MENSVINRRVKEFSKAVDFVQTVIIFSLALLVPTFLGSILKEVFPSFAKNAQIIIGTIVNATLIVGALNLKGRMKLLGIITMPSISTILSGYVFQSSSTYMVFMIPAIWLGNLALIYAYKYLMLDKKMNYFLTGIIGIIIKISIIFSIFSILKLFNVFPNKLVENLQIAMSTTQLITACFGMMLAFFIYKIEILKK